MRKARKAADRDAGYIRVSSLDLDAYPDRDSAIAHLTPTRIAELQEAAGRQGKQIPVGKGGPNNPDNPDSLIFADMDLSGRSVSNRPAMLELIAAARQGRFSRLWIRNLSRTFRNLGDQISTLKIMRDYGVEVISLGEPSDGDPALIELVWNIIGSVNQHQSQATGELIKRQNRLVAASGKPPTGRAPLGYIWDREAKELRPDPELKPAAIAVFRAYVEEGTYTGAAMMLNAQGIKTSGGALWRHAKVADVIRNPIYRGRVHYDGEEWPGLHPLIIPEDLMRSADELLGQQRPGPTGQRSLMSRRTYSRLLVCGLCGSSLRAQPNRWGKKGYCYWICSAGKDRGACDLPRYRTEELDRFVLQGVQAALASCLREFMDYVEARPEPTKLQDESAAKERSLKAEIERLGLAYAKGIMPFEQYERLTRRAKSSMEALKPDKPEAARKISSSDILAFRRRLTEEWAAASEAERHELLSKVVAYVQVYPDRLTLHTRLPIGAISIETGMFEPYRERIDTGETGCKSSCVNTPPVGLEPTLRAPEARALSPELRGHGNMIPDPMPIVND